MEYGEKYYDIPCNSVNIHGKFPPGSMGPKIQTATNFIKGGGKSVIITDIDKVKESIAGETGTRIVP